VTNPKPFSEEASKEYSRGYWKGKSSLSEYPAI
jgi:hypothetical protein